jgi:hypothetical protein
MSIKSFKQYIAEADADEYKEKEDANVDKELEPRAKAEKDFADALKAGKDVKHPVAGDHQFNGSREQVMK